MMALDVLGISLEHHRAGRLTEAEAGYRSILERDPKHADALHWLGVLLYQAGDAPAAWELLARAVALRADDPAFQFNFAQACLASGHNDEAIAAFERAGAMGIQSAEWSFGLGVALHRAGRIEDAIASLRDAVRQDPNHAVAFYHLAAAYRTRNEPKEVRKCLNKALEIDPEMAQAWQALGVLEAELGNRAQSESALRRVARMRQSQQRPVFAQSPIADLQRRLMPEGATGQLYHLLANELGLPGPASASPDQVAALFDKYADSFDQHLCGALNYRAPDLLADAIRRLNPRPGSLDVLDLGCGTGLCGPPLRAVARTLMGVDLSRGMIQKARERGSYDELFVGELVEFLKQGQRAFDLLVAADVLNYIGDLAPVMESAVGALRNHGQFAFTIEVFEGERFQLQRQSHRYAHSRSYIAHLARILGFEMRILEAAILRTDNAQPVHGCVIVLELKCTGDSMNDPDP
jgi:predicted TPR repeat methyltransferase